MENYVKEGTVKIRIASAIAQESKASSLIYKKTNAQRGSTAMPASNPNLPWGLQSPARFARGNR